MAPGKEVGEEPCATPDRLGDGTVKGLYGDVTCPPRKSGLTGMMSAAAKAEGIALSSAPEHRKGHSRPRRESALTLAVCLWQAVRFVQAELAVAHEPVPSSTNYR
jgi:hypothetical protein